MIALLVAREHAAEVGAVLAVVEDRHARIEEGVGDDGRVVDQDLRRLPQLFAGLGKAPADLGLAVCTRGRAHGPGGHHPGDAGIVHRETQRKAGRERMADHAHLACRQQVEHCLGLAPPERQVEIGLLLFPPGGAEADQVGGRTIR